MLTAVQGGPSYPARVLALEKKGFGFSILKAEDLAIASDIQLPLEHRNVNFEASMAQERTYFS
jgi:hypothetical protein